MCGFVAAFGSEAEVLLGETALRRSLERLRRRGPDDEGRWRENGVVLGHRRLAILDVDHRAAQPLHSGCGRYVIVYNGEIYNFRELRRELEASDVEFRTTSDTEVILALFAAHGEAMLPMLHGMFALAIWDRRDRKAFVARDPYGIKPLYVSEAADAVLVASQVKALLATGRVSREPDPRGQASFWMLGSVPEPHTWFREIRALPAGHCTWIKDGRLAPARCWHDIGAAWRTAERGEADPRDVRAEVRVALQESVARHLVADVPVGVFLSGGIDSGAVAALMGEAGARDLEGVTIAYDEYTGHHEDEAPVAARVAAHYGIRHTVRRVTRQEFLTDLPRILDAMDQPSIDGVNTWYASKAVAERGLKVVVSGVGGDELFQGYGSFRTLSRLLSARRWMDVLPGFDALLGSLGRAQAWCTGNRRWSHLAEWSRTIESLWWLRRSVHAPEDVSAFLETELTREALAGFEAASWVRQMTGPLPEDSRLALGQIESMTYLRNQLLRDSDWASMDHGVELRTPLVDGVLLRRVQPALACFREFSNKSLLADSPASALPAVVTEREKTGFSIPVQSWLRESAPDSPRPRRSEWIARVALAYAGE